MFEGMMRRIERLAAARARTRAEHLAERLDAALPQGVRTAAAGQSVRLSGRRLRRRIALDARLHWLIAGMLK